MTGLRACSHKVACGLDSRKRGACLAFSNRMLPPCALIFSRASSAVSPCDSVLPAILDAVWPRMEVETLPSLTALLQLA